MRTVEGSFCGGGRGLGGQIEKGKEKKGLIQNWRRDREKYARKGEKKKGKGRFCQKVQTGGKEVFGRTEGGETVSEISKDREKKTP